MESLVQNVFEAIVSIVDDKHMPPSVASVCRSGSGVGAYGWNFLARAIADSISFGCCSLISICNVDSNHAM